MENYELTNEHKFVLYCSRIEMTPDLIESAKQLVDWGLNWKQILLQGIHQKTLQLIWDKVARHNYFKGLNQSTERVFETMYNANRFRNLAYLKALSEILALCNNENIIAVPLKGAALLKSVYKNIALRTMGDIDLLINPKDAKKIGDLLNSLGYTQGVYAPETKRIIPVSRQTTIYYKLYLDTLPEFSRLSDDPFLECVDIDVHTGFFLQREKQKCDVVEILNRTTRAEIEGEEAFFLDKYDFVIQLCAHIYKEATTGAWIDVNRDINIIKFCDLRETLLFFQKDFDWRKFIGRVRHYEIHRAIYYVFHYLERIYANTIDKKVLEELKPNEISYLNQYGFIDEKVPKEWIESFENRLFNIS